MKRLISLASLLVFTMSLNSCGLFSILSDQNSRQEKGRKHAQEDQEGKPDTDHEAENNNANGDLVKPIPSYPYAEPVLGRPGFVYSPYNKLIVDVNGLKKGVLVYDPSFPREEKKYFFVP